MPAMDETLVSLDCIHGAVSVVGSMNADYTVTTERLPKPGETVLGGPLRVLPGGKSGESGCFGRSSWSQSPIVWCARFRR